MANTNQFSPSQASTPEVVKPSFANQGDPGHHYPGPRSEEHHHNTSAASKVTHEVSRLDRWRKRLSADVRETHSVVRKCLWTSVLLGFVFLLLTCNRAFGQSNDPRGSINQAIEQGSDFSPCVAENIGNVVFLSENPIINAAPDNGRGPQTSSSSSTNGIDRSLNRTFNFQPTSAFDRFDDPSFRERADVGLDGQVIGSSPGTSSNRAQRAFLKAIRLETFDALKYSVNIRSFDFRNDVFEVGFETRSLRFGFQNADFVAARLNCSAASGSPRRETSNFDGNRSSYVFGNNRSARGDDLFNQNQSCCWPQRDDFAQRNSFNNSGGANTFASNRKSSQGDVISLVPFFGC